MLKPAECFRSRAPCTLGLLLSVVVVVIVLLLAATIGVETGRGGVVKFSGGRQVHHKTRR